MRVASNSLSNALIDQLGRLTARQNRLQQQAASGQRVHLPEDDPASVRRALDLQAKGAGLAQYQRNMSSLKDQANASYQAIRSLKNISDRAREIAILADGTRSPTEIAAYADELNQLIRQGVQSVNQKFDGSYLFGGTRNGQAPFVLAADSDGRTTGVAYQGNSSTAEVEIAEGATLSSQTLGANPSGAGPRGLITDPRAGADFFNHLIALQTHLAAGDTAAIAADDQPRLGADEENFLCHFARLGATLKRLDTASAAATQQAESVRSRLSGEVDADLPQTLVQLNQTQLAYQAALQSAARLLGQSLLDYLN